MGVEKMPTIYRAGIDIDKIISSLPEEEREHMKRVGRLVDILTGRLYEAGICGGKLRGGDHELFGLAAAYHDIGKVRVPRGILMKPGRLTEDEVRIIMNHPVCAAELFERIKNGTIFGMPRHLIKPACDAALYHHEQWDGKGYPYGLRGRKIPLIARITSICDVYDVVTNERAYKAAYTHDYACNELEENAGRQLDPALVRVFLENEADFRSSPVAGLRNSDFEPGFIAAPECGAL